jgi:hypothetical protein
MIEDSNRAISSQLNSRNVRLAFIEKFLGFAPEHHDGSLEAIILIAAVTLVTALGLGYFHKHQPRD